MLDYEWWEDVYVMFKEDMVDRGFDVDLERTHFGRMYCQGQGAGFTAILDTRLFIEQHDLVETYPHIMMLLNAGGDIASLIRAQDTYSVTEVDGHDWLVNHLDCTVPIIDLSVEDWDVALEREVNAFEYDLRDAVDGYCSDLMDDLLAEYEYRIEDEKEREKEEILAEIAELEQATDWDAESAPPKWVRRLSETRLEDLRADLRRAA